MPSSDSSDCENESRGARNTRRLGRAQRRGLNLTSVHPGGLTGPVDLRLNRYGLYDTQQLIANLVKLAFILGMNSPDSPVVDLPYELFQRITDLNKFIYGTILARVPRDNSYNLHMAPEMPMLGPQPPSEPSPENDKPPGCRGGKSRRRKRSKTRRRSR